jgi:hypothetical protein
MTGRRAHVQEPSQPGTIGVTMDKLIEAHRARPRPARIRRRRKVRNFDFEKPDEDDDEVEIGGGPSPDDRPAGNG